YILCCDSEYEDIFRIFIEKIKKPYSESEFQFLERKELYWEISDEEDFYFRDFYYVNQQVLIINRQIWDKALSIVDTDEIFDIPLVISKCGEQHYYTIVVPSRINCFDYKGKIIARNVGRYHIFKSTVSEDFSVYVSERLMRKFKEFTTLEFKGVE
ncbi:MAG: hypothetical protein K2H26_03540, partial [Ruminococcus sp.]|nr:hypothetical protein [Ruminococcus sp.]